MLRDKRILLGVTGGIAAYKAVQLLRDFQKAGADVRVVMTPAATQFVGLETFRSLTGGNAACHIFQNSPNPQDTWVKHVHWAEWADLFVVAPCTANTLAKIASGSADNLLTTTLLASRCPVLLCPTMDGHMYDAPATKRNLRLIRDFGYHLLEPEDGYLASGMRGKGRLPEPASILEKVEHLIQQQSNRGANGKNEGPLQGKNVVVTAGPTREHIDPVRYISNPSSGKMGIAMAHAARKQGAEVTLIHGPLSVDLPSGVNSVPITSAQQLHDAIQQHRNADIFILAAAVSDFAPEKTYDQKIKKDQAETTLQLISTPDSLEWLGHNKKDGQLVVGFAMETDNLIENAQSKRKSKKADWIIANSIADTDSGFASDRNRVVVISQNKQQTFEGPKNQIAEQILHYMITD